MGHLALDTHLLAMTELTVRDPSIAETTLRRAASGDEVALGLLIAENHDPMVKVAYVIIGDAELAREAAQVAWTVAWPRLRSLRDPERIRPWLVAIAANEARQIIRRERRRTVVEISTGPDDRRTGDPDEAIEVLDLKRALRRLKPEDRSFLALRFVAGLDSTQLGKQSGMSASGVRSRLSRLLERLRKELDDE
jgi:RNA polymerase sigma-70 factor (ECF subfamily)